jgi:hypothetical protein
MARRYRLLALLRHHSARIDVRFRAMQTLSRRRRMTEFDPQLVIRSIHSTCLSALVTD